VFQCPTRDTDTIFGFQRSPYGTSIQPTINKFSIQMHESLNLRSRSIAQNFDSKIPDSQFREYRNDFRSALSISIVQRISATDVGMQYMLDSDAIAKPYIVAIAGSAAVGFVCPG
jgi:hypothetical protein